MPHAGRRRRGQGEASWRLTFPVAPSTELRLHGEPRLQRDPQLLRARCQPYQPVVPLGVVLLTDQQLEVAQMQELNFHFVQLLKGYLREGGEAHVDAHVLLTYTLVAIMMATRHNR